MLKIFKIKDPDKVVGLYPEATKESKERIRNDVKKGIEEMKNGRRVVYGTKLDGEIIGTGQLVYEFKEDKEYYADNEKRAHVTHVRIGKEFRGQGLGKELMKFIENKAEKKGFSDLTLGVDSSNKGAFSFYEKLGYTKFREEKGDEGEKIICMKKTIKND